MALASVSPGDRPSVSVIIVNWNGRHLLPVCLDSLAQQTMPDFETIVVDNGSTDGSADWIAKNYPRVHLIRLDQNTGFCGGNNVGLRAARGQWIALLNNDTEVAPGWLEALYQALRARPEAGACDSRVFFYDRRELLWAAGADYTISGSVVHRGYLQDGSVVEAEAPVEVFVAIACAVMYRRSALEQVGLFDEDFFSGYEDVDLSFRLHLAGYRVLTAPGAVVYHRVSETARINSRFYVLHGQKNVLYTFLKNMPGPLLLKYLPLHLVYTLGSLAYFARQRQLQAFLQGKWMVLRQGRRLVEKRRQAQQSRVISLAELDHCFSRNWYRPKAAKLLKGT